ncbi:hypothetical protein V8E51_018444 [Hyaloscypha variabilis]
MGHGEHVFLALDALVWHHCIPEILKKHTERPLSKSCSSKLVVRSFPPSMNSAIPTDRPSETTTSQFTLPTSTSTVPLTTPPSPTFTIDNVMNLVFGLSAFIMAAITIWQNRHYMRSMKLPWKTQSE